VRSAIVHRRSAVRARYRASSSLSTLILKSVIGLPPEHGPTTAAHAPVDLSHPRLFETTG